METELVPIRETVTLAKRERTPLAFTPEQRQMILNTFANGARPEEFEVLMAVALAKRLNPLLGQCHFIKRWTQDRGEVWAVQTGIDGFRSIAEDTGLYDGQDEPVFVYEGEGEKRHLVSAKVCVYRKDIKRPFVGVAHFGEYCQRKKDGSLTKMWWEKPHIMIAKCAESLAFRKAFPQELGNIYTAEEMGRADEEHEKVQQQIVDSPPPKPSDQPDWIADIEAQDSIAALDALAQKMNGQLKGAARANAGKAWKARRALCCEACGFIGRHTAECPEGDGK